MESLVILLIVGLHVAAAVATALKGKPWFLLIGLLVSWFWLFGALRLAKPQSWWARRFYGVEKLEESKLRFAKDVQAWAVSSPPALDHPRY